MPAQVANANCLDQKSVLIMASYACKCQHVWRTQTTISVNNGQLCLQLPPRLAHTGLLAQNGKLCLAQISTCPNNLTIVLFYYVVCIICIVFLRDQFFSSQPTTFLGMTKSFCLGPNFSF